VISQTTLNMLNSLAGLRRVESHVQQAMAGVRPDSDPQAREAAARADQIRREAQQAAGKIEGAFLEAALNIKA
jgi:hypothetical protein